MTFLNFSQLPKSVFRPNFIGKHFPGNQAKFPLTGNCFLLTTFFNGKQTQESLKNDFPETTFQKTNIAIVSHVLEFHHIVVVSDLDNNVRVSGGLWIYFEYNQGYHLPFSVIYLSSMQSRFVVSL